MGQAIICINDGLVYLRIYYELTHFGKHMVNTQHFC